ncbi:MAG: type II toxin-antitoxin system RelE/ParE family toxin [Planctomycetes bacterium]|nr:type II toxin-antitoxin system RelE/ParE family toxin [Planctomycetota bacterium]MBM4080858.1 type II toxin-antitoxin system RelE/ParE family toxin [Planctomycetota bacterium]MBM4087589.1 type II toxin-antitoxin system RelE/ParE family toxin [Planctomycetota bacterium]
MYEIDFTPEANEDLDLFRKFEQQQVLDEIERQLKHQPSVETRNRKRLRPNNVADWELRIGKFRVFYNVEDETRTVSIEAVGFKVGNLLFIRGQRREL